MFRKLVEEERRKEFWKLLRILVLAIEKQVGTI